MKKHNSNPKISMDIHLEYVFEKGINFRARIITLSGLINGDTFSAIDAALTEMESYNHKPVTLRLNSEGGSVYDALAIVGRIQSSPCEIITEGYGAIMSAASLIFTVGDRRRISECAWFMVHESSYEAKGKHSSVQSDYNQTEREEDKWAQIMADGSNKDAAFWRKTIFKNEKYFTPEQLILLGVADEIF